MSNGYEWNDWICPNCEEENIDSYEQTARPLCSKCGIDFDWDSIMHNTILVIVYDREKKDSLPEIDTELEFPEPRRWIPDKDDPDRLKNIIID